MTQMHLYRESPHALAICELGLKNQRLISRCLDYGLVGQVRELKRIDEQLAWLLRKTAKFDFVGQVAKG